MRWYGDYYEQTSEVRYEWISYYIFFIIKNILYFFYYKKNIYILQEDASRPGNAGAERGQGAWAALARRALATWSAAWEAMKRGPKPSTG